MPCKTCNGTGRYLEKGTSGGHRWIRCPACDGEDGPGDKYPTAEDLSKPVTEIELAEILNLADVGWSPELKTRLRRLAFQRDRLLDAIKAHHGQKADDRCIEDDDKLYAAAGLPPCDRRVGNKGEMLLNCARYIDKRCESGGWQNYRDLEAERDKLKRELEQANKLLGHINEKGLRAATDPDGML